MNQTTLKLEPRSKGKPSLLKAAQGYEMGNKRSAELIVAEVDRYGGETSGLVLWARGYLRRLAAEAKR